MTTPFRDPSVAKIASFLEAIGLRINFVELSEPTFLPGIAVRDGTLTVDESRLLYPGDLLHEAGHLAMLPRTEREACNGEAGDDGGLEMAAIAWSWAATIHLELAPNVVFHEAGYRGGAANLIENFSAGRTVGVPLLEWAGLTATGKRAAELGVNPYPAMLRWLRD